MIKAARKNRIAQFSDAVWATGVAQRRGWVPLEEPKGEKKIIPQEILDFAEIRKAKKEEKPLEAAFKEPVKKSTTRTKKDDHSKQEKRPAKKSNSK